ncbi:MAG: hypothetical protein WBC71_08320, partial [Salaquimonas sp.]
MKTRTMMTVFVWSIFLIPRLVHAEESCSDALIIDNIEYSSDISVELSALSLVQEGQFNTAKKNFGSDGKGNIYGVPVDISTTFKSFNESRKERLKKHEFKYSEKRALSYVSRKLSPNAVTAYVACLEANSRTVGSGFHAFVREADEDFVQVDLMWAPPTGA